MASFEKIEERLISGKGLLRMPSSASKYRVFILYLDMVRPASSAYGNFTWNPPKGRFCNLTFRRERYIVSQDTMEFTRQSYTFVNDPAGQAMIAVKCAYQGILQSFANIATAQGLTVISVVDLIKNFENLALVWDEVLIGCVTDYAIQARLYGMKYDTCNPESDKSNKPPVPPPPLPRVPPRTPIADISDAYDGGTDGGFTVPNPIDEPSANQEQPPGDVCVLYAFDLYLTTPDEGTFLTSSWVAFGEVSLIVNPASSPTDVGNVGIRSRGLSASYNNPPSTCNEGYGVSVVAAAVGLQSAEIRNFRTYE